jgi:hypothetical protein
MKLLVFLLLPLLLLAACGGGDGGEPATPQLPEGFPADFPIYGNATITAASRISAAQGDIYAIGMQTTDAADDVRSFYEDKLAVAPWEVSNVVDIPEENTVVVEFARREGDGQSGTLAIQAEQTDGQRTIITISLPAPAVTVTPTPPASPAS